MKIKFTHLILVGVMAVMASVSQNAFGGVSNEPISGESTSCDDYPNVPYYWPFPEPFPIIGCVDPHRCDPNDQNC